jgi:hypothetical protein
VRFAQAARSNLRTPRRRIRRRYGARLVAFGFLAESSKCNAGRVRFAVNFDVITKQEWEEWRRAFGAPERPSPSWLARRSIGDPVADGLDRRMQHWWDLRVDEPVRPLADDVLARIKREALPAMRKAIAETSR